MTSGQRTRRITPLPQIAAGDCGVACLAMILQAHGSAIDIHRLRGAFDASINGISLKKIIQVASQYRLSSRAVRAEPEGLKGLRLPAMLHWNFNHYVVLESIGKQGAIIIDPASGRRRIALKALAEHFTGIAVEFRLMPDYTRIRQLVRTSIADFWTSMKGAGRAVTLLVFLSLGVQAALLIAPFLFAVMIDQAVGLASEYLAWSIFGAIVVASLFAVVADLVRRFALLNLGSQFTAQVNLNLVDHLLRLPYQYFQNRRLSDLLSRVDSTRNLRDALTEGAVPVFVDGLFSVVTLILLVRLNPVIAAITVGAFLVFLLIKVLSYPEVRARAGDLIDREADQQAALMETLRGVQVIKTMNAERIRLSAWHGASVKALTSARRLQEALSLVNAARSTVVGLDFAAVAVVCAIFVIRHDMTLGVLFAIVAIRQQLQDRIYPLLDRLFEFRLLGMRLQRLRDITEEAPEIPDDIEKTGVSAVSGGALELQDVRYRYAPDLPWVLDGVTLRIEPGEFVAINGRSGGGKSTLIRILIGLLRPGEGRVAVDGHTLSVANLEAYRNDIAVVMQDDQLFTGTIFDNISGFDPNADADDIAHAARLAEVADDIESMPMGYFSFIGDMGSTLSGGQYQRVLLARALYHKPRILFLDEGTANLDPLREGRIIDMLKRLGITVVCIAHRSKTLEEADRVYEMRGGCLHLSRDTRVPMEQGVTAAGMP
ncbi:peptidase domain-containing ABC transporter [Rothia nasimurium]|uniref:Peptidase domain-containing ABC transporter n=1 Tax=Luteibacter anthropi TaxID=564369 RepID=A0A7X5ZJM0_9GAMM|nr:peptidase domain-containing ABC transporter [Luteibacter anthropi]NII07954.1 peptidase domain-containing ABC transporter [Luteibacter anthropi]